MPIDDYQFELGKAHVVQEGNDITLIGWGPQLYVLEKAALQAEASHGITCEIIDLRTILPYDIDLLTKVCLFPKYSSSLTSK